MKLPRRFGRLADAKADANDQGDPFNAAAFNRRENRRTNLIAALVVLAGVLSLAVIVLAARLNTGVTLLEQRTPIINRIDESEASGLCTSAIGLRFSANIVRVLAVPSEQRRPFVVALVAAADTIEKDFAAGKDPCAIQLPALPELPPPTTTTTVP